jgi:replicative DNA helicase
MTEKIRLLPHDLIAEKSCLGCQVIDPTAVDIVREIISPSDFYLDSHQMVQRAILAIHDGGRALDIISLAAELASVGQLNDVGGNLYLVELLEAVPYSAHAAEHAGIIAQCSRRRAAIRIGQRLVEGAYDLGKPENEVLAIAASSAASLSELMAKTDKTKPRPLSEHVASVIETYKRGGTPTVRWGIPDIDAMIRGVAPGELVVIGGRPSQGKSMVGLQWLDEAAGHGIPSLMISEEMSAESLASRQILRMTSIPESEWSSQLDRVAFDSREHFAKRAPLLVAEKVSTAAAAERCIARAVKSHGVRIVGVDYAQLLEGSGDNKQERVADVSSRMKAAAMKHDIVVLLLAQLNREMEKRKPAEPHLSDLRDSGGLEQDADIVLFPFWPFQLDDTYKHPTEYRVYCRKNRNRGIREHVIRLKFNAARQRLEPWDDWCDQ